MRHPRHAVLAPVLAVLALAGCTPAPRQTDTPEPMYSCTPVTGGTPYPCIHADYQINADQNAVYAEAEAALARYTAEDDRILRSGGADEPTLAIRETTTGEFQKWAMDTYRSTKSKNQRLSGGHFEARWTKRLPTRSVAGSTATVQTCTAAIDIRWETKGKGRTDSYDGFIEDTFYFVPSEGLLKIATSDYKKVTGC